MFTIRSNLLEDLQMKQLTLSPIPSNWIAQYQLLKGLETMSESKTRIEETYGFHVIRRPMIAYVLPKAFRQQLGHRCNTFSSRSTLSVRSLSLHVSGFCFQVFQVIPHRHPRAYKYPLRTSCIPKLMRIMFFWVLSFSFFLCSGF